MQYKKMLMQNDVRQQINKSLNATQFALNAYVRLEVETSLYLTR